MTSWASVLLVDIDGGGAALREALEQFDVRVERVRIGQARHLVSALSNIRSANFVVLSCHGQGGNILIPELAPELESQQPFHQMLTPEALCSFARLDGALVISTGCETASPAMAQAMLSCGATGYLAPTGQPHGYAAFFVLVHLFYELTQGRPARQAVTRLREHDPDLAMWHLHISDEENCG